jgi:hypothetical protein
VPPETTGLRLARTSDAHDIEGAYAGYPERDGEGLRPGRRRELTNPPRAAGGQDCLLRPRSFLCHSSRAQGRERCCWTLFEENTGAQLGIPMVQRAISLRFPAAR